MERTHRTPKWATWTLNNGKYFTMSLTETKPDTRSLSRDKQKREQERREAIKREIAKNNPKIDNNIVKGYN